MWTTNSQPGNSVRRGFDSLLAHIAFCCLFFFATEVGISGNLKSGGHRVDVDFAASMLPAVEENSYSLRRPPSANVRRTTGRYHQSQTRHAPPYRLC
ncbi:hypothetical protein BCV69DRAFT_22940 [Microstroma glucosiphilum]|uniref:Uncharacterized protein n=1 Tax=Pseudomicrostroma glucosiphilum TaxID=1684307 RepID=A0A316UJQ3_9BASI|nr:hypothetical protein BCV69DRAFT_22940 [Pseudomicrostroma glucosiphilum]PWN24203.1 hypothetical protein BCV69DRAFT_22940 [Pseudomicrostroma glucosiphilum]